MRASRTSLSRQNQTHTPCFSDLPFDLWLKILQYVESDAREQQRRLTAKATRRIKNILLSCEMVCKTLKAAVAEDAVWAGLWKRGTFTRFLQDSGGDSAEEEEKDTCRPSRPSRQTPIVYCVSTRDKVCVTSRLHTIRRQQHGEASQPLRMPGDTSTWGELAAALWDRWNQANPISYLTAQGVSHQLQHEGVPYQSVDVVLTKRAAHVFGEMLEMDLVVFLEKAQALASHRHLDDDRMPVVIEADLALLTRLERHDTSRWIWTELNALPLPEICPGRTEVTQSEAIRLLTARAGILKYSAKAADLMWERLLQRAGAVMQRVVVKMIHGIDGTAAGPSGAGDTEQTASEDEEGEGEELTETEDDFDWYAHEEQLRMEQKGLSELSEDSNGQARAIFDPSFSSESDLSADDTAIPPTARLRRCAWNKRGRSWTLYPTCAAFSEAALPNMEPVLI